MGSTINSHLSAEFKKPDTTLTDWVLEDLGVNTLRSIPSIVDFIQCVSELLRVPCCWKKAGVELKFEECFDCDAVAVYKREELDAEAIRNICSRSYSIYERGDREVKKVCKKMTHGEYRLTGSVTNN